MTSEARFKARVKKDLEKMGYDVFCLTSPYLKGVSDLLALAPPNHEGLLCNPIMIWLEVKKERETASKSKRLQFDFICKRREQGHWASYVWPEIWDDMLIYFKMHDFKKFEELNHTILYEYGVYWKNKDREIEQKAKKGGFNVRKKSHIKKFQDT